MANQTLHMKPNVAAAIAYVFGWLSGLIGFLFRERKSIRAFSCNTIYPGFGNFYGIVGGD